MWQNRRAYCASFQGCSYYLQCHAYRHVINIFLFISGKLYTKNNYLSTSIPYKFLLIGHKQAFQAKTTHNDIMLIKDRFLSRTADKWIPSGVQLWKCLSHNKNEVPTKTSDLYSRRNIISHSSLPFFTRRRLTAICNTPQRVFLYVPKECFLSSKLLYLYTALL